MLTIFTTCKPCINSENEIQQFNAMKSWSFLEPHPQILVMGNDQGTSELASKLGYQHLPDVKTSDWGTPLLDDMFRLAEEHSDNDHLALISSDVILFQSVIKALSACEAKFQNFCAICRKKQQTKTVPLDFDSDWQAIVREKLYWNLITSGDFYMYNRGFWEEIPPFIIGRCMCDSWLFWEASRKGQLVDVTQAVEIIDYKHTYNHWFENRKRIGEREKEINYKLAGSNIGKITDANWIMNNEFQITKGEAR